MNDRPIAAGKSSFDIVDRESLFSELALKEGDVLLDVASGVGNYSLAAATLLGNSGRVYAFDLWQEGISELERRTAVSGLKNVTASVADVSRKIGLADSSVDVCLIATALHDLAADNKDGGTLKEVFRVMKPQARLVIVEFNKQEGPPGPPRHIRLSPAELDELAAQYGFKKQRTVEAGDYTYISTFTKSSRD